MALYDTPAILLAVIEDEASANEILAQKTHIFGELLTLFAPDYQEPPYTVKALAHLAHLLWRWSAATSKEMQRLHRRAGYELRAVESDHECIACTSLKGQATYKRTVTTADIDACPSQAVRKRYGLVM